MTDENLSPPRAPGLRLVRSRSKLSEQIAEQLRELIQSGELKPGVQLPTESEMIEQFGVSRTVVREAISALRADGLVNPRQGKGVFVSNDISQQPFRILQSGLTDRNHILHIMELRLGLEVEAAGLAAQRRSRHALDEIIRAFDAMGAAVEMGRPAIEEDYAFHLRIAEATGNRYIAKFLEYLGPFIIPRPVVRAVEGADRIEYLNGVVAEHLTILEAIKAGDTEAASSAMRTHLLRGLELNRNAQQF